MRVLDSRSTSSAQVLGQSCGQAEWTKTGSAARSRGIGRRVRRLGRQDRSYRPGPPITMRRASGFSARSQPQEAAGQAGGQHTRSEEHTSELQSLMRIPYAVFGLKKK